MIGDIIGLLSGLLAVFTFLTGTTSVRDLVQRAAGRATDQSSSRRRSLLVLGVSAPIFVLSMVATYRAGMDGSDTGGAQFVLLLVGAILLLLYATRWSRSMGWTAFLITCLAVLGSLGFLMGTISIGEEAEGVSAGLTIGLGIGLLALAFRRRPASAPPGPDAAQAEDPEQRAASTPEPSRADRVGREREILALVQERGGEVTAFEVGLHTSLSLAEAREMLDRFDSDGFCQRRKTPDGATVYRFPDVRPAPAGMVPDSAGDRPA